jgi:protein TonB
VYRVARGVITPPRATYAPDPKDDPAKRKLIGTVTLFAVLSKEGIPEYIRVQKSLDPERDQSSIDAVKLWKFIPAMKDGKPVLVMINVELNFPFH